MNDLCNHYIERPYYKLDGAGRERLTVTIVSSCQDFDARFPDASEADRLAVNTFFRSLWPWAIKGGPGIDVIHNAPPGDEPLTPDAVRTWLRSQCEAALKGGDPVRANLIAIAAEQLDKLVGAGASNQQFNETVKSADAAAAEPR